MPSALRRREKLKFRRREQASLRALGYGFVLGVFIWPLSALIAGISATTLAITLAAPVIANSEQMGMGPWTLDTAGEGLIFLVAFGPPFFVVSSYLVGVVAGAEASLAKAMLGPRQEELQRNVAELRRSRLDLVDAFETERRADRAASARRRPAAPGRTHDDARAGRARPARGGGPAVGGEGPLRGRGGAGGSARGGPGDPPTRAGRPRAGGRRTRGGGSESVAGDGAAGVAVTVAAADRGGGVLRRQRGTGQRGEARPGFELRGDRPGGAGSADRHRDGRRDRRREARCGDGTHRLGRPRLDALGGTLVVDSPPGGPTRLRMECPCRLGD